MIGVLVRDEDSAQMAQVEPGLFAAGEEVALADAAIDEQALARRNVFDNGRIALRPARENMKPYMCGIRLQCHEAIPQARLYPAHTRHVEALGATRLEHLLGMPHGDEREGNAALLATDDLGHGIDAVLLGIDAEPYGT